ncbi:MAG: hypothetical protein MHM6MM_000452 [Cercozoa sp. M6MM]
MSLFDSDSGSEDEARWVATSLSAKAEPKYEPQDDFVRAPKRRREIREKREQMPTKFEWRMPPRIDQLWTNASVGTKIDLRYVSRKFPRARFDPRASAAGNFHFQLYKPRVTVQVHSTGTVRTMGSKSLLDALVATRIAARMLARVPKQPEDWSKHHGRQYDEWGRLLPSSDPVLLPKSEIHLRELREYPHIRRVRDFCVSLVSGQADLGFDVDLKDMHNAYDHQCQYDPHVDEALKFIAREDPPLSFSLRESGQISSLQCRSEDDFYQGMEELYDIAQRFRVGKDDGDDDVVLGDLSDSDGENDDVATQQTGPREPTTTAQAALPPLPDLPGLPDLQLPDLPDLPDLPGF